MTGPLANEFAQVERALLDLRSATFGDGLRMQQVDDARAALARIEEHTHNTEKALLALWNIRSSLTALATGGIGEIEFAEEVEEQLLAALSAGEGTPA